MRPSLSSPLSNLVSLEELPNVTPRSPLHRGFKIVFNCSCIWNAISKCIFSYVIKYKKTKCSNTHTTARTHYWDIYLNEYRCKQEYKPGKSFTIADALSALAVLRRSTLHWIFLSRLEQEFRFWKCLYTGNLVVEEKWNAETHQDNSRGRLGNHEGSRNFGLPAC